MKKLGILLIMVTFAINVQAQTKWKVDPFHSSLNFTIEHSGISMVNGKFTNYSGTLTTEEEELSDAKFKFTVHVESINTNVEKRDQHLRSADFFEVEKYPEMSFKSNEIIKTGKLDHYLLFGDLTIKGITKEVVFDLYYGGKVKTDQGEKLGLKAETTINRLDYNIDYDPTGAGIAKDVNIVAHLQFVKQ
ncbi:YceI family protein [Gramella jeungdoensis]|uniref:YceI family protein n=1 Tax=Gramella jeungdoensis TaxID=708091 RepID=A0ABT0Z3P8_9FLAO|nr:YceI family protein [Gramella jeungdoensis]MCM8570337.1 YceI family protein [Gramella jeungdoensis]